MRKEDKERMKIGVERHASGLEQLAKEAEKKGKPDIARKLAAEATRIREDMPGIIDSREGPEGRQQREWAARGIERFITGLRGLAGGASGLGKTEDSERYGTEANDLEMRLLPDYDDRPQLTLPAAAEAGVPAGAGA